MNSTNKQEKIALITGGARRIGAAITKALHNAGFTVAIHYQHSLSEAEQLAYQLNSIRQDSACIIYADLQELETVSRLLEQLKSWQKQTSSLTVLVNNASQFKTDNLLSTSAAWQALFAVNVLAPYCLSRQSYAELAKNQGVIINITDIHAKRPLKHYSVYCQSKAALQMQTMALAREFSPKVRVNAVAPGAIMWPEKQNELSSELQAAIIEKTPLKKHGSPCYIAKAVLSLVNNDFITGQTLSVDGGRSIV